MLVFLESDATALAPSGVDLMEIAAEPFQGSRVEGHVIRGVKIVGRRSQNPTLGYPTVYTQPALTNAIPLYEGAPVHLGHPPRDNPGMERPYQDRIGRIRDVKAVTDGLRGDLHLNPEHPTTKALLYDAKHEPDMVGLSHNARGDGSIVNGEYVVSVLTKVHGVDVVTRPSTTRGLFESVELQEATAGELVKAQVVQEASRRLVMDFMDLMHSIARSPLDAKTKKDQLRAAMQGLMAAMEDDMGADAKKIMESVGGQAPIADPTKKPDATKLADTSLMEARVASAEERAVKAEGRLALIESELATAKKRDQIHAMVRELKLPAHAMTPRFEQTLMESKDAADMKVLLEERLRLAGSGAQLVESRAQGAPPAGTTPTPPVTDSKSFARALGVRVPG